MTNWWKERFSGIKKADCKAELFVTFSDTRGYHSKFTNARIEKMCDRLALLLHEYEDELLDKIGSIHINIHPIKEVSNDE